MRISKWDEIIRRSIAGLLAAVMLFGMLPNLPHVHAVEEGDALLAGKTISILGASISTYAGTSNGAAAKTTNSTIGSNAKYYPHSVVTDVKLEDTWWMQVVNDLGLRLLVNNSWSGSSLLYERNGTKGAYVDRCVQLHDDTGDNAGEMPDIIGIQMGTNDFQYYKDTLGTADIDYDTLITENTDGTYTYAAPVTSLEAAAIVLHKISVRYPDAEVYYLNISQRVDGTDELIRSFNAELKQVVEHFGAHIVDIYGSAITMDDFDTYIGDGRVHPNKLGMDAYAEAFKRTLIANTSYSVDTHTVSLELEGVSASYGDDKIVVSGDSYTVDLTAADALQITVTMGGQNITDSVYSDGTVIIDAVTDDVTITAKSVYTPKDYRWEFDGTDLVCVSGDNALTKNAGTTADGVFSKTRYALGTSVQLLHDQPWIVEWKCEGTFLNANGSSGARVFTSTDVNAEYNARYIFKSNTNGIIAMGEKTSSGSHNYGLALADYGIDWTELHTYRLENRIAADGSNMIWLYVDGEEIGPLNNYYVGTTNKNTTSDWLSGKDFVFPYMGTDTHGFTNASIDYIAVWEGEHTHSYETNVTAPTCTEQGYTTYTCICGDSYVGDYVDALGHSYKNGSCTGCGEEDPNGLPLDGLNVLCLGDSITYGQGLTTATRWTNVLASKYGWTLTNKSQGGISLSSYYYTANGTTDVSIAKKAEILKTMTTKPDVIIVWGGHNDITYRASPLGTWEDNTTDSFKGALKYIAELADEYAPDATLFVLTPLWNNEKPSTLKVPENTADTNWMFVDAIYEGAEKYGWIPINMDLCGITPFTKSGLLLDNIHPNEAGTEKIVEYLSEELASYGQRSRNETIIFNQSSVSVKSGESTTLKAVLSPRSGNGSPAFIWSSSDPSVATVDSNGVITAVAHGNAIVTATADNGVAAAVTVAVAEGAHTYTPTVTAPTCTEQGYTIYTCTCGESYTDSYVEALGHSYENGLCTFCGQPESQQLVDGFEMVASIQSGDVRLVDAHNTVSPLILQDLTLFENCSISAVNLFVTGTVVDNDGTNVNDPEIDDNTVYTFDLVVLDASSVKAGSHYTVKRTYTLSVLGSDVEKNAWNTFDVSHLGITVKAGETLGFGSSTSTLEIFYLSKSITTKLCYFGHNTTTGDTTLRLRTTTNLPVGVEGYKIKCDHEYAPTITAPTCTKLGYTTHTCVHCGDSHKDTFTDAAGHSWEEGVCTACGAEKKPYQRLTYFTVDVVGENGKLYTDNAVLYLPADYSPDGEPVKLIIYCKQGASQITASSNPIEGVGFYNYLISLGYAVLGVDGVPDAWRDELGLGERAVGNPMAVQGTQRAYDYVVDNYNIASDGCFISGYSQGGHYAQNVIDLTDIPILAAAEQSPVCSMRYHQWDLNANQTVGGVKFTKAARLNVARIYGFPEFTTNTELLNLAYDASLVDAYDPWVRNSGNVYTGFVQKSNLWYLPEGTSLEDITMTKTAKCPVKIWCAEDDTAISADVMKVFVKAIQNAGGTAEISVAASGGHGFFQNQTAVGTFTENGKTYKTLPIAVEIAQWFQQYGGYECKHTYADNVCTVCGEEYLNLANYKGKVISVMGDSISTFAGYIPAADGFNLAHRTRYPDTSRIPDVTDVNQTWWMQVINELDAKLGVNESWAGSCIYWGDNMTTQNSDTGEKAAMASLTRIQNLGSNGTPDVIFLLGGGNDKAKGVTVGSFDPAKVPDEVDLTATKWDTFADAYVAAIMRMQHYYPDAQIVVLVSLGSVENEYIRVIKEICAYFDVPCRWLFECGIDSSMYPDGSHPNAEGMDIITDVVLDVLSSECNVMPGENTVYSLTHNLTNATASKHYYRGISGGLVFEETLSGEALSVNVTMNGLDITDSVYANGRISIPEVTGDVVITVKGSFDADGHLQQLPETLCPGVNLWTALEPENIYYTATGWGNTTAGTTWSITFPVQPGDRIWATSLGATPDNGSAANGVRVTWFNENGVLATVDRNVVYNEFAKNGYITAPEGAVALNIPMTNNQEHYAVYILSAEHSFANDVCSICGKKYINPELDGHLQQLPEKICAGTNLWTALEPENVYYLGSKWGLYSSAPNVHSVTFPVASGERLWATSFGPAAGDKTKNGTRVTWFNEEGVLVSVAREVIYEEFQTYGYITVPDGAIAVNIPMVNASKDREIYLLDRSHTYSGLKCTLCGAEHPESANYSGKVISILGASTCTFDGYIPVADGFNLEHVARYPQDNLLTDVNDTWWMQVINDLDAKLGINDSWRSTEVYNACTDEVNSSYDGTKACLSSVTRIQNLGSNGTPDVILFFGATNDITQRRPLGTFDPDTAPTEVDLTTETWTTVVDAYTALIMRVQHFYPDAQFVALLPYSTASNSASVTQKYTSMFAAICEHYGVTCIDLNDCGISVSDLPDGVHPNAEGMDYITNAVLEVLLSECEMEAGENVVHSVTHSMTNATASMSYYKGISSGRAFSETLAGENLAVSVIMGGQDITSSVYADGKISIPSVSGDLVITVKGIFNADGRLEQLPEKVCSGTNIWTALEPVNEYYTASGWGNNANNIYSVTFPVIPGERIWATSFGTQTVNQLSGNGTRITWFSENGVLKSVARDVVYSEFAANGYITVPEGATAVNIPMRTDADTWEIFLLDREHCYGDWYETKVPTCDADGEERRECISCEAYETRTVTCGHGPEYSWDVDGDGVLEILAIGNSFSVDALQYAYQIAQDLGVENVVIGNLYIGGCTLETHAANAAGDLAKYTYYYNNSGTWTTTKNYKISTALESRSWDYISMQQASSYSGVESTYNEDLTDLIAYVNDLTSSASNDNRNPCAKLVWHMTWAYQQNSTHSAFPTYGSNQMTMYNSIVSALQNKIVTNSNFDLIVPNGTAVQNARTSLVGDTLTRDGYHMSYDYGRYLTGLMFVKTVTGLDISGIEYAPDGVSELYQEIAVESVNNAYAMPFAVTQSAYTGEVPEDGYVLLQPALTKGGYWHPLKENKYNVVITDATNSASYFASPRFTKEELPVGSIIILEDGWQYRPDGWVTDSLQTGTREAVTTAPYVVITEQWWEDYTIRGFNISKVGTPSLADVTEEEVRTAFRIYVPEELHKHSYVSTVTEPTCTEAGYTTYACSLCADSYTSDPTEATGHTPGEAVKENEAVDGAYDSVVYCSSCGEELSRETIKTHTPGDINGDGNVDNKDLTRLFRYLSGYDVSVVEAALDVNGDGSVNNKDQTRLFRYLSGWDVEIY